PAPPFAYIFIRSARQQAQEQDQSQRESSEHQEGTERESVPAFSAPRSLTPADKEQENATQRGVHGSDRDDGRPSSDDKFLGNRLRYRGHTQPKPQDEAQYAWYQPPLPGFHEQR